MNLPDKFLDTLNVGLFVVDMDLTVHFWNEWLDVHTGISKADIEKKPVTEFFHIEEALLAQFKRSVKVALALKNSTFFSASVHHHLLPIRLKKIRSSHYDFMQQDVTISPIDLENHLVAVTIYNQTNLMEYREEIEILNENLQTRVEEETNKRMELERQKLEQEKALIRQSRMAEMGSMIAAIAHQFKQPLNIIGLHAQELMEMYEYSELNKDTIEEFEHKILSQVQFMSSTVSNFANFFKTSKDKKNFFIKECVEKTVFLLSKQLASHNITTNIHVEDGLSLFGLQNEFQQVIFNIVNNAKDEAIHKSLHECVVDIEAKRVEDEVIITISDNALGIQEDAMDKIFENYFTTKGDNGTGIGLSIAKIIVESEFKGKIEAKNIENGASFIITIPATQI